MVSIGNNLYEMSDPVSEKNKKNYGDILHEMSNPVFWEK